MYLASSESSSRLVYHLLAACNLVLVGGVLALVTRLLEMDGAALLHLERLGRTGPLGVLLVVGSGAWAWVDLLFLPMLAARAEALGNRTPARN